MGWPVLIRTGIVAALTLASVGSSARAQDAVRGEYVYRKCALCHVVDPNAKDLLAPPLHNIIGRRAAQVKGFDYSDIMKVAGQKGLFWSPDALNYFLDRPEEFMPGTYMAFSGIEEQERRDVIAYLEKITRDFKRAEDAKRRTRPETPPPRQSQPQPRNFSPPNAFR